MPTSSRADVVIRPYGFYGGVHVAECTRKMQEIMQNAEITIVLHFCHICYCNHFPKYAIMPLVKSKNNASVFPKAGKPRKTV